MNKVPDNDYIQAFMTERVPDLKRSVLVVVDMQYATGHRDGALGRRLAAEGSNVAGYRFDRIEQKVVPNIKRLLSSFREADGSVLYLTIGANRADCSDAPPHMISMFQALENYEGNREHEIVDELKPRSGESVINKTTIGAFASTGIDHLLRSMGKDQLYMSGVSTNMCVDTTAREAADRGYAVTLIEDACGTTHEDLHNATITNFQRLFGRVISTESALTELGLADH